MANGYAHRPGELNVLPKSRDRSQTAVGLPPAESPQKKRASPFYPPRGVDFLDETNPDPFYLEHSLGNSSSWSSGRQGFRNARLGEDIQKYFMLSAVSQSAEDAPVPPAAPRLVRSQANVDRSTLSAIELEQQLSSQQIGVQPWGDSQTEFTPDLTPSSSFSSNHSASIYPDPVVKATEQLYCLSKQTQDPFGNRAYPYFPTPLNRSGATMSTEPSSPVRDTKPERAPNASAETVTMAPKSYEASSLHGKPLPSLPAVPRPSMAHLSKKQPPSRLAIEPSMISPPSLINQVTREPHRSHFDQALFIPANECPSPVPSPGPPSPSVDRQPLVPSMREWPFTSTSEMHPEQSVWESDSDAEDSDPRSLSRKPMDTLKKVRSRVQLRVAKSAPKLQNNTAQNNAALEKSPEMLDPPPQECCSSPLKTALQTRTGKDILRPTSHQALRLVVPSTSSLVRPPSRRNSAKSQTYGIDRSTAAAAIQAKSRRRQRPTCPETPLSAEREKMCTFCREERSDRTIHHGLTLSRPPLYRRIWESLRVLACHGEITSTRPAKGM
ncbi:hypothetical protein BDW66DRAFT_167357 [Aspergillus desertorum]